MSQFQIFTTISKLFENFNFIFDDLKNSPKKPPLDLEIKINSNIENKENISPSFNLKNEKLKINKNFDKNDKFIN